MGQATGRLTLGAELSEELSLADEFWFFRTLRAGWSCTLFDLPPFWWTRFDLTRPLRSVPCGLA
jgi:hypothetical protein